MRRFSQRNSLVTLSDINITPLLDLAFVLLIIFVITTPLLEKGLELNMPKGEGQADKVKKEDIRTIEVSPQGIYTLGRHPMKLDQILAQLVQDYRYNPNLVVYIRGDKDSRLELTVALIDGCLQRGISRYSLRLQPQEHR